MDEIAAEVGQPPSLEFPGIRVEPRQPSRHLEPQLAVLVRPGAAWPVPGVTGQSVVDIHDVERFIAEIVAVLLYSQVSGQLRWRLRRGGVRAERRSQIFRDLIGDLRPDSGDAAQPHDIDLVFPSVHVMTAYGADLAEGVAVKALLDQNILAVAQRLRNKGAGLVFRELTPLDRIVLHGEVETQAAAVHQGHVPPPDGIAPVADPRRPNLVGAGIDLVGPVSSLAVG